MAFDRHLHWIAPQAFAATLICNAAPGLAQDTPIIDPKAWCGEFSHLVAEGHDDEIGAALHSGSLGNIDPSAAITALEPMTAMMKTDEVKSVSFLAQKNYEGMLERDWYMMVIGPKPTYLRCTFIHVGDKWQLSDFDFNTDLDKLPLP
jgi:hypothetical protein